MASVPHPLPSRMAQNVAALYGHEDDTLIAWQRVCVQAAEVLRPQPDPERLTKALALAQGGHVEVEDDGFAVVTSGTKLYHVQADGTCDCPGYQHRGSTPCKHVLAVLIHTRAQELVAPSPSPAPLAPASSAPAQPPAPAKPSRQPRPTSADRWAVTEAPASCCLRLRVGELELMYTMRDVSDAELTSRVQHLVPWVQDLLDQARERQTQLEALRQQREAAKAAPAAPLQPPAPTPAPADLPALLQQAVQQALAAANGQAPSTPPPALPSNGTAPSGAAPDDQQTGFCSIHQAEMTQHTDPASGDTWYSHYLEDAQRYCKGARPTRRNGHRR